MSAFDNVCAIYFNNNYGLSYTNKVSLKTLKTNVLNVHFLHLNGSYYAPFQETSSVGNFGILALANHLHAQKPIELQERENPKSIINSIG